MLERQAKNLFGSARDGIFLGTIHGIVTKSIVEGATVGLELTAGKLFLSAGVNALKEASRAALARNKVQFIKESAKALVESTVGFGLYGACGAQVMAPEQTLWIITATSAIGLIGTTRAVVIRYLAYEDQDNAKLALLAERNFSS